ncbi:hypothetical protein FY534_03975 [Alicyclobacillus sp. TC]|uniref:Energy-coupling factor transporter transmembrane protein EcfT n=2 Tax=Alicyclobacillaceae TaxID=186823 RepID=A0A1M6SNZ6_9BACL|nr:hypothetical protein FY534_03975 [Alicyclobacillus sp. TC]SHK46386.1 Energy-coupling factor transporter transmembrane protein EcfT [Alicyclobacillus montanus]
MGLSQMESCHRSRMNQRPIIIRQPHPYVYLCLAIAWLFLIFSITSLWQMIFLWGVSGCLFFLQQSRTRRSLLSWRYLWILAIVYAIVQIFADAGTPFAPLIWTSGRLWGGWELRLTPEGLYAGILQTLRYLTALLSMTTLALVVKPEDIQHWLPHSWARLRILLSLLFNMLPMVMDEYQQIREWLSFQDRLFPSKQRQNAFLAAVLKVGVALRMLLSRALERSWKLSETMMVRGYGIGQSSRYLRMRFHKSDGLRVSLLIAIMLVYGYALLNLSIIKPDWISLNSFKRFCEWTSLLMFLFTLFSSFWGDVRKGRLDIQKRGNGD